MLQFAVLAEEALCVVLNQHDAMLLAQLEDGVVVRAEAVEGHLKTQTICQRSEISVEIELWWGLLVYTNGDDGFRARGDDFADGLGVDVEAGLADVREHGDAAVVQAADCGGRHGERRDDDLVPRTQASRPQRRVHRRGAVLVAHRPHRLAALSVGTEALGEGGLEQGVVLGVPAGPKLVVQNVQHVLPLIATKPQLTIVRQRGAEPEVGASGGGVGVQKLQATGGAVHGWLGPSVFLRALLGRLARSFCLEHSLEPAFLTGLLSFFFPSANTYAFITYGGRSSAAYVLKRDSATDITITQKVLQFAPDFGSIVCWPRGSCGDAPPPLAGAPGAAGSGQELTVPPGRSRHAVLKKITERSRP